MGYCKKDATPLLMHWSYIFLALTNRYKSLFPAGLIVQFPSLINTKHKSIKVMCDIVSYLWEPDICGRQWQLWALAHAICSKNCKDHNILRYINRLCIHFPINSSPFYKQTHICERRHYQLHLFINLRLWVYWFKCIIYGNQTKQKHRLESIHLNIIQWNLSITTTLWDASLPSGAHLGGQGPTRWAPEGRNC